MYLFNTRTKTKQMTFIIDLHIVLTIKNFLTDNFLYLSYSHPLILFYVCIVFVEYWDGMHSTTHSEGFGFKVFFKKLNIHWSRSHYHLEIMSFLKQLLY